MGWDWIEEKLMWRGGNPSPEGLKLCGIKVE